MERQLILLAATALLSLFAPVENAVTPQASVPHSGVAIVLSIDDSPRAPHP